MVMFPMESVEVLKTAKEVVKLSEVKAPSAEDELLARTLGLDDAEGIKVVKSVHVVSTDVGRAVAEVPDNEVRVPIAVLLATVELISV